MDFAEGIFAVAGLFIALLMVDVVSKASERIGLARSELARIADELARIGKQIKRKMADHD